MEIDLVYLWVNGNDPKWQAKRNAVIGKTDDNSNKNCKGRYADNDELKYSLRAVEMYAPWIRMIFIVTDDQIPEWLDTSNPKVQIVDHKEILPPESLPCFNSSLLEHFFHRIPGLSEHFLYANDDMFFNRPVNPSDFYAPDGLPIFRFAHRRPCRKLELWFRANVQRRPLNHYNQIIENGARLVEQKLGKYYSSKSHHNVDAYLKSDFSRINSMFWPAIEAMLPNHVRSDNDVQRHLYAYAALAEKRGHRVFVDRHTSFHLYIHRQDHYEKLEHYNPKFFCMNDSEFAHDADRIHSKEYLEKRFPAKSQFEK